ncbi:MAG: helix-turn-helix domain-containing protein [Oscillospiraceae bacterium]|nr:helix-turn-helix domain-containing protein [Oscillospiraceae bacterium]
MKIFIERLKLLRKQKNITQRQLAEAIKTGERNVRSYEISENLPSLENVIKIADFFDVSVDYLVGRSDEQKRR